MRGRTASTRIVGAFACIAKSVERRSPCLSHARSAEDTSAPSTDCLKVTIVQKHGR